MSKYKFVPQLEVKIEDAISSGYSILLELRDEVQEVFDNATENLQQTSRMQTFSDTAGTLDNFVDDEPDVPEVVRDVTMRVTTTEPRSARQTASRSVRRDNAVAYLRAAAEALTERLDGMPDGDAKDEAQALVEKLEQDADEAEGVEFPGMFG